MLTPHLTPVEKTQAAKLHARAGLAPNALGRLKDATGLRYDAPVSNGAVRLVISHCEVNAKGYPIFDSRTVFEEIGAFPDMGALLAHCEEMLAEGRA
jgi:hypothetical protein